MGRYINWKDVSERYMLVAGKSASEVNTPFIMYAEAEIESRLAPKFSVPFDANNLTVRDLCIDKTLMKVLAYKDTKKAESIGKDIDARVKRLLDGTAQMLTTSGDTIASDNVTAWSETKDYHPRFGHGDIVDMQVDSSQTYAEDLERD